MLRFYILLIFLFQIVFIQYSYGLSDCLKSKEIGAIDAKKYHDLAYPTQNDQPISSSLTNESH